VGFLRRTPAVIMKKIKISGLADCKSFLCTRNWWWPFTELPNTLQTGLNSVHLNSAAASR